MVRTRRIPQRGGNDENGFSFGLKPQAPQRGLVPLWEGSPFRVTPGEPADPRDCDRYPDSPLCGGNPLTLSPAELEIEPVIDNCNIGIQINPSLGFIKLPPVQITYRHPNCRDEEANAIIPIPSGIHELKNQQFFPLSSQCVGSIFRLDLHRKITYPDSRGTVVQLNKIHGKTPLFSMRFYVGTVHDGDSGLSHVIEFVHSGMGNWSANSTQNIVVSVGSDLTFNCNSIKTNADEVTFGYTSGIRTECWITNFKIFQSEEEIYAERNLDLEFYYENLKSRSGVTFPPCPVIRGKKNPPPPPKKCKPCMSCCCKPNQPNRDLERLLQQILKEVKKANKSIGSDELPATFPKRLIYPNGKGQEKTDNLLETLGFLVKQIDKAVGLLPQKIKVADTNAAQAGNQSVEVEIHSFADFCREMLQYSIDTEGDVDVGNNMLVRCLYELGFIHQGTVQGTAMLDAICEHLDFKQSWKAVNVPFAFDPYAGQKGKVGQGFAEQKNAKQVDKNTEEATEDLLPKLLKNTDVKIRILINDEEKSLNDLLQDIKRDTAIAAAGVSESASGSKLDDMIEAAQAMIRLQSVLDRRNTRQSMAAGKLILKPEKKNGRT